MIRLLNPAECKSDFERLTTAYSRFLDDNESLKFLSYTLLKFDKKTIEEITRNHKKTGLDYLVYEKDNEIIGILAFKRNPAIGFELFVLIVDRSKQKGGIGESLINECIKIAAEEKYKCVDTLVFADNKNMLRLLIKKDFRPIEITHHSRADGMDLIRLRLYFNQ
jgi:ribosomal protein S18 acetylase RimI-like enzyme